MEAHLIENATEWNELVMSCSDFNVFSTFEWGEYKKRSWDVRRLAFTQSGDFVGGTQILLKRKFGLTCGWSPGGIHLTDFDALTQVLGVLTGHIGQRPFALRINFLQETTERKAAALSRASTLARARHRLWVGSTVMFDLDQPGDAVQPVSENHRRNYKKALRNDLTFEESEVQSREFVELHSEMVKLKNVPRIALRVGEVEHMARDLGDHMKMYSARRAGELVSSCLIIRFGAHAYYYLGASSETGRKLFSSFYLIVELLKRLKAEGVKRFDFAGVALQRDSVRGVSRFKAGFSGRVVDYLGEYDLTNNRPLCRLLNLAIGRKFRG